MSAHTGPSILTTDDSLIAQVRIGGDYVDLVNTKGETGPVVISLTIRDFLEVVGFVSGECRRLRQLNRFSS